MSKTNYMSMKEADLKLIAKERDLDIAPYTNENGSLNRKAVKDILTLLDVAAAGSETPTLVSEDDTVTEDIKPTQFKKKGFSGVFAQVTFYNTDENDLPYVQLGLNGNALYVPKEKEVWIPKEFIEGCLKNAIITKLKQHVGEGGKISYIPKKVQRHSYQVLDMKHVNEIPKEE